MTALSDEIRSLSERCTITLYTVKSVYYVAAYNDFPGKTIHSIVFDWFYISNAVILVVYNDIGYNNNPDITIIF